MAREIARTDDDEDERRGRRGNVRRAREIQRFGRQDFRHLQNSQSARRAETADEEEDHRRGGAAGSSLGGASGAYMFLGGSKPDDENRRRRGESRAPKDLPPLQAVFFDMPDVIVNIQGADGNSAYLKLAVALELSSARGKAGGRSAAAARRRPVPNLSARISHR